MKPNDTKFKELVLYIARRCESDKAFGATKLNKILFFSDFLAYGKLGDSITGHSYQKLEWGPAPVRLLPLQKEMIEAEDCALQRNDRYGHVQKKLVALREADLSVFSANEIAIVDGVIASLWDKTAVGVSDISHDFVGWEIADMQEIIPYESVFLSKRELSPAERQYAKELRPTRVTSTEDHRL